MTFIQNGRIQLSWFVSDSMMTKTGQAHRTSLNRHKAQFQVSDLVLALSRVLRVLTFWFDTQKALFQVILGLL